MHAERQEALIFIRPVERGAQHFAGLDREGCLHPPPRVRQRLFTIQRVALEHGPPLTHLLPEPASVFEQPSP